MKTKLPKILFALMCTLAGLVHSTATLAAGATSYITTYQPKVPEKLRR